MANVNSALTPLQKHAHVRVSFQLPAPDQEGKKKATEQTTEDNKALVCGDTRRTRRRGRGLTAVNRLHARFLRSIKGGSRAGETAARRMTGSSIDWLRLKIGESGRIDAVGAWTQSWTLAERERYD